LGSAKGTVTALKITKKAVAEYKAFSIELLAISFPKTLIVFTSSLMSGTGCREEYRPNSGTLAKLHFEFSTRRINRNSVAKLLPTSTKTYAAIDSAALVLHWAQMVEPVNNLPFLLR
jgi:hypothetical protein